MDSSKKWTRPLHRAANRKKTIVSALSCITAILLLIAFLPISANAMPFFSRQTGKDCSYCHSVYPKLNETGLAFRSNGYRLPGQELKDVKDWSSIPASLEVTAAIDYGRLKSNGDTTTASDIRLENVQLSAGGAMGKTGRVSTLGTIAVEQDPDGTFATTIQKAFVQVNDLAGETGNGNLNVRAGQWEMGLPFLSPLETVMKNQYLAERDLGIFARNQTAAEINGQISLGEESKFGPHRYSIGISTQTLNSQDKVQGFYATYALTIKEMVNLGIIYRGGKEVSSDGTRDVSFNKYGAGAEVEVEPFIITAGIFRADKSGENSKNDFLIEALYKSTGFPGLSAGARYDVDTQSGFHSVQAATLFGRYDIITNVFTQLEYDHLSDKDHRLPGNVNETENRLNLFLSAIF